MTTDSTSNRTARSYVRAAATLVVALLAVNLAGAIRHHIDLADAAPVAQLVVVKGAGPGAGAPLQSGGSATSFGLQYPAGSACTGDANAGYLVSSFIVSSSETVDTLAWGPDGPAPTAFGGPVRVSLFSLGNPVVNITPSLTSGALTNIPPFDFGGDGLTSALFPSGTYTIGLACTRETPLGKVLDKYWSVDITITASPTDLPNGFTWTVGATPPPPPTTTTTTTTTVPVVTTTTTTVPVVPTTTTTVPVVTTTTTTVPVVTTTTTTVPVTTTPTTVPAVTTTTTTVPAVTTTTTIPATTTTTVPVTTTTVPAPTTTVANDDNDCRDRSKGRSRGKGKGRCERHDDIRFDDDDHRHARRAAFSAV